MPQNFKGKYRLRVTEKNAGFAQRFRVTGATSGNGTYSGVVGTQALVDGPNWSVTMEWNNGQTSGWQESVVIRTPVFLTPIIAGATLGADDNVPANRDGDYDDLVLTCERLDPIFDVVQRPFAMDRGTLTMAPDGVFDVSQGIQYMGVRVRNTWDFDWTPGMGVMIGIASGNRIALQSQGVQILDGWGAAEQQALQQTIVNGYVPVPELKRGAERTVYFKVDVSGAAASKPQVSLVAQTPAYNSQHETPTRQIARRVFLSRSSYNPATRELIAEVPEGKLYLRLNRIVVDRYGMQRAMAHGLANRCLRRPLGVRDSGLPGIPGRCGDGLDRRRLSEQLSGVLREASRGRPTDPCDLQRLLQGCCDPRGGAYDCRCEHDPDAPGGPGTGGGARGPGTDDWCRFKPFHWLPLEFEYRVVPNPAYPGQFGPLAFEDPWWKVVLIIVAILLAIASLIYDYINAGQDPQFVIGNITRKSSPAADSVDAAIALLNDSRGRDMDVMEAQGDDRNNGLPINGATGGTVAIDRTDNGDRGIADAVVGNVVFKSGARSGTTRGTVDSISLTVPVDGVTFTNQVRVVQLAAPQDQPLSQGGDSGSLWVDLASRRPVALNFAGPVSDDGTNAIANRIRAVVELFDIHFNV